MIHSVLFTVFTSLFLHIAWYIWMMCQENTQIKSMDTLFLRMFVESAGTSPARTQISFPLYSSIHKCIVGSFFRVSNCKLRCCDVATYLMYEQLQKISYFDTRMVHGIYCNYQTGNRRHYKNCDFIILSIKLVMFLRSCQSEQVYLNKLGSFWSFE